MNTANTQRKDIYCKSEINLYNDRGELCFIAGKEYQIVMESPAGYVLLIDETKNQHEVELENGLIKPFFHYKRNTTIALPIPVEGKEEGEIEAVKFAEELVEKFRHHVATTDFHLPKFITGVDMADGSEEYKKAYDEEERSLAIECAITCVEQIQRTLGGVWADVAVTEARSCQSTKQHQEFYTKVLSKLKTIKP